jgi:hypothetical protein
MGTFGTGIFDDDLALDVRGEYLDLLATGRSDLEARRTIENDWKDSIADSDDGPVIWLALAATQWEYGRLSDRVKRRALQVISTGKDVRRWESSSQKKRRNLALERLRAKLQSAQPGRRTPRKRAVIEPDSFSVKSPDQKAEATSWTNDKPGLDGQPFSQVFVMFKLTRSEGGGGVFAAHCHCSAIRMKWLANDKLQISYPKDVVVDDQQRSARYDRRTIGIKYRRY